MPELLQTAAHRIRRPLDLGGRTVQAISDGQFRMPRDFLTDTRAHDVLADSSGAVLLPIGCLYVPGPPSVLIDAGVGPVDRRGVLIGGGLVRHLAALGVGVADIDIVALTHLHVDHVGWVATADGDPVFPSAQVVLGRADWRCFLDREGADDSLRLEGHIEHALRELSRRGRVTQVDGEQRIAPAVTAVLTAGHTPGHNVFLVTGKDRGLCWFGDLISCPQQLTETGWAAASDVDPEQARQARSRLWDQIAATGRLGLGAHFPGLETGSVRSGIWHPFR